VLHKARIMGQIPTWIAFEKPGESPCMLMAQPTCCFGGWVVSTHLHAVTYVSVHFGCHSAQSELS
jgi:hypothetical protein